MDLGRLTIFVGENGTRKSMIVQALALLKRSAEKEVPDTDLQFANLGPLSELVHPGKPCFLVVEGKEVIDRILQEGGLASFSCAVHLDSQGIFRKANFMVERVNADLLIFPVTDEQEAFQEKHWRKIAREGRTVGWLMTREEPK